MDPGDEIFGDRISDRRPGEFDLGSRLQLIARNKRLLLRCALYSFLGSILIAFLMPVYYSGETGILPPQQTQSMASSALGQLAPLMALSGKDFGLKNPADMYVALLQSRTVADAIVEKFHLQDVYKESRASDARKTLEDHTVVAAGKDGIIRVSYEDKDQHRAVLIANEFTRQLYRLNQQFAITEASQRRVFFGEEMKQAKNDLFDAEMRLKKTQETTGLIQLDSQAKAIISSVATLRAQVAAKEVELHSMQLFSTDANPEYLLIKQQLSGLRAQLAKAETAPVAGNGDIMVPTGSVPKAGLEFMRSYRDVQYYQTIFELLAKQYEIAKIDEAKSAPILQVVDQAVLPDRHSKPHRSLYIAIGFVGGVMLSVFFLALFERRPGMADENIFRILWREIQGV
jgi:uncharacterized protein involved in exopolysaccharide biosynthesis